MAPIGLKSVDRSVVKLPIRTVDPRYLTAEWQATRSRIFKRDHWTCVAVGCGRRAVVCDHLLSPANGGTDEDFNLRSLCRAHDAQVKEAPNGVRRNGGKFGLLE